MSEQGTAALIEAARRLLYEGVLDERLVMRALEGIAASLLDPVFVESPVYEAYREFVERLRGLLAKAMIVAGIAGAGEAAQLAGIYSGVVALGEGCVLVRARRGFETGKLIVRQGAYVCMPPREAAVLAAVGLVEPVSLWEGGTA